MLCSLLLRRRRFPSAVPRRAPSWLAAHLSVKRTPHWIIQSHCGRNRKVYWPTTVGPTEKDAAADSLCAAASMPTISLSLPSLSLSLTRPMRSLPSPTRPQVRLRVVSIELLCAAMSSEALKAPPHNELRGRMIACFFKSLMVRLVTLAAAAPVPPAECGGQAGPTRAAARGARLPAGPLLSAAHLRDRGAADRQRTVLDARTRLCSLYPHQR